MKPKEAQAASAAQARYDIMKKLLNIFAITDLSVLTLWLIIFIIARLTADTAAADYFAAAFVIIYAIAIVAVLAFTVASVILLIKKKEFSLPLLIFTYVMNFAWIAVLIAVVKNMTIMGSPLF